MTPGEAARAARAKVAPAPDLQDSLLRALKEHSERAREKARAAVQEELASAASLADSQLKALSHTLASADEEEAAARRQQLAQLAAEAADARAATDKALAAFKKVSADKLATLQRVRAKVAALEAADAARPAPNKAECDKARAAAVAFCRRAYFSLTWLCADACQAQGCGGGGGEAHRRNHRRGAEQGRAQERAAVARQVDGRLERARDLPAADGLRFL